MAAPCVHPDGPLPSAIESDRAKLYAFLVGPGSSSCIDSFAGTKPIDSGSNTQRCPSELVSKTAYGERQSRRFDPWPMALLRSQAVCPANRYHRKSSRRCWESIIAITRCVFNHAQTMRPSRQGKSFKRQET